MKYKSPFLMPIFAAICAAMLAGCAAERNEESAPETSSVPETSFSAAESEEPPVAETTEPTEEPAAETVESIDEEEPIEEKPEPTADEIQAIVNEAQGLPADTPSMFDNHNADNAAKPGSNKTPDGKYSLADTDLVNPDGTYTVKEYKAENLPTWTREESTSADWSRLGESHSANASKIPYSQITLENAKDAFPFLGYVGEWPGYLMILPSDSPDVIALKVYQNLIGKQIPRTDDKPYYQYSSEAEHKAAIKHYEEEMAKRDAEAAAADAHADAVARGEEHIGDGFSQEAIDNFFS